MYLTPSVELYKWTLPNSVGLLAFPALIPSLAYTPSDVKGSLLSNNVVVGVSLVLGEQSQPDEICRSRGASEPIAVKCGTEVVLAPRNLRFGFRNLFHDARRSG